MSGGLLRLWSRERQSWQQPRMWKFFAFMALSLAVQGLLAVGRGDRWFALLGGTIAVVSALFAVLAYKAAHRR